MNDSATILVIESQSIVSLDISQILISQGFQVFTAVTGRSGLHLAKQECPDIIICSIRLPDIEGFEVLACIRTMNSLAKTRFIFLTGQQFCTNCRRALQLGANDALGKPTSDEELLEAIALQLSYKA